MFAISKITKLREITSTCTVSYKKEDITYYIARVFILEKNTYPENVINKEKSSLSKALYQNYVYIVYRPFHITTERQNFAEHITKITRFRKGLNAVMDLHR